MKLVKRHGRPTLTEKKWQGHHQCRGIAPRRTDTDGDEVAQRHLGGHVAGGADNSLYLHRLARHEAPEAQIAELDVPSRGDEDIAGFDVAVHHPLAVHVVESITHLQRQHEGDDRRLCAVCLLNAQTVGNTLHTFAVWDNLFLIRRGSQARSSAAFNEVCPS